MTTRRTPTPAAAVLFGLWGLVTTTALPLAAQTVYRCGNAYADVPCPMADVVDVDDSRTTAQQADARAVALREAALATRMAADRQRSEARAASTPVKKAERAKTTTPAASAPMRSTPRSRTRFHQDNGQGDFVAFVPRPAKK